MAQAGFLGDRADRGPPTTPSRIGQTPTPLSGKPPRSPPPTPGTTAHVGYGDDSLSARLYSLLAICTTALSGLRGLLPALPHRRRRIFSARSLVLLCLLVGVLVLASVGERAREGRWRSEVDRRGNEWREFLKTVPPYNPHLYPTKRGIVYTAGRADLPLAIVSIIMLRTLGCQLPIEIVHFRGELGDREKDWVSRIPGGNIVLRDVESMVAEIGKRYWEVAANLTGAAEPTTATGGVPLLFQQNQPDGLGTQQTNPSASQPTTGPIWVPHLPVKWDRNPRGTNPGRNYQLKAAAVLFSSFEEVLYLDADNFPVMDPSFLFEHASFREGTVEVDEPGTTNRVEVPVSAVFWPDYRPIEPDNPIFRTLGLPRSSWARREKAQEAGQLVLTKPRCWKALNLALYMASDSSLPMRGGRPFYYLLLHGDKDTFRFAWRATGTGFYGTGNEGRAYVLPAGDLWSEVDHDWWSTIFRPWSRRPQNATMMARDGAEVVVPQLAGRFCGHTMVQAHPSAPSIPLFFHTNEVKYHATGAQSSLAALSARLHPTGRRWTYYQRYVYRDPRTGLVSSVIPRELLSRMRDRDTHWLRGFPSWSCRMLQEDRKVGLEVETVRVVDKEGGVNDVWRKGVQGMLEVCGGEEEVGIIGKGKRKLEKLDKSEVGMRTRRWGWSRWILGDGV